MSARDKWVRRFSVDETAKHRDGFTIYKITSVLFPLDSPEAVSIVSVWRRYSETRRLHRSLRGLHAALPASLARAPEHFPALPVSTYFTRFQPQVIEERARAIQKFLEFVAEHRLLFTSAEFVNFLQSGHTPPAPAAPPSVIEQIRSSLKLPPEDAPPIEYSANDDDLLGGLQAEQDATDGPSSVVLPDIPIYESTDIEIRRSPKLTDSFESFSSLESFNSDFYDELNRMTVKTKPSVKTKPVLPDLINFDAPSTSKFEDYHTMRRPSNTNSELSTLDSNLDSNIEPDSRRSLSRLSLCSKLSHSDIQSKTRTEDSYVFEAGYKLNLAARHESASEYQKAFDCYKDGIEIMLIGVQTDPDPARRALIKEKTNRYLSYAETLYRTRLASAPHAPGIIPTERLAQHGAVSAPYRDLSNYRVLAAIGTLMLVLHDTEQTCYVIKVIQKIPNNLTEFDEFVHHRTNETRQPILPTDIPYMVPLKCYIDTPNLIFLVLHYAPGEKLFDYIRNYVKSTPNTPARELNLENVFSEPKTIDDEKSIEEVGDDFEAKADDISVKELVCNSQKLLKDVDRVLSRVSVGVESESEKKREGERKIERDDELRLMMVTPPYLKYSSSPVWAGAAGLAGLAGAGGAAGLAGLAGLAGAARGWGAEVLTAIEHLHLAGVVCRNLNPKHILLGAKGHAIVTYRLGYSPPLPLTHAHPHCTHTHTHTHTDADACVCECSLWQYIAPELYHEAGSEPTETADYWSFGAILYQLICAVPLSHYHRSVFTSHTLLQMPDGIDMEAQSILTQLLTANPNERLGAGGIHEIKSHPYYKTVDWQRVLDNWCTPD